MKRSTKRARWRRSLLAAAFCVLAGACGGNTSAPIAGESAAAETPVTSTGVSNGVTSTSNNDGSPAPAQVTTIADSQLPSDTLATITDRGSLRIGYSENAQLPYFAASGTAEPGGFEGELGAEIASRLAPGLGVEWVPVPAANRFDGLAVGDFDVYLSTTVHTASRESDAAWSQPYLLNGVVAIVPSPSAATTVADLDGLTVAVPDGTQLGALFDEALATSGVSADIVPLLGPASDAVLSERADAAVADWLAAVGALSQPPASDALTMVGIDFLRRPVAAATAHGDPAFGQAVDAAIGSVIDDGTWALLFEEWFGFPPQWSASDMAAVLPG